MTNSVYFRSHVDHSQDLKTNLPQGLNIVVYFSKVLSEDFRKATLVFHEFRIKQLTKQIINLTGQ